MIDQNAEKDKLFESSSIKTNGKKYVEPLKRK